MNIYSISSTPYYDNVKEEYKNIITINTRPNGPLSERIKMLQPQRISSFVGKSSKCIYAILAEKGANELMDVANITELFNFLSLNNYQIDTSLTTMMHDCEFNTNSTLICFIRRNSGT
jgi:hypothetical protein